MERFDVFDSNGHLLGYHKERGHGLDSHEYYLGAHGYIFNKDNGFLIQRRSENKSFLAGAWDIHMGHVMAGESSGEAIIREVYEELGLHVDCADYIGRTIYDKEQMIVDLYFMETSVRLDDLTLQEDEVMDAKYVTSDEMIAMVEKMDYRSESYRQMVKDNILALINL